MHDRASLSYRFRVHKDHWYVIAQRGYADVVNAKSRISISYAPASARYSCAGIAAEELRDAVIAPSTTQYRTSAHSPMNLPYSPLRAVGHHVRRCALSQREFLGAACLGTVAEHHVRGTCVGQLGESSWSCGAASARLSRVIRVTVAAVVGAHAPINTSHASMLSLPIYLTSIPRSTCERPLSEHPDAHAPAQEVVQYIDPLFDPAGLSTTGGPTLSVALHPRAQPSIRPTEVPQSAS
jgi:hypothetical protein